MSTSRMERPGRRPKAGSLSGLPGAPAPTGVRRQRSVEWVRDRYSSSDEEPPQPPPLADHVFASLLAQATQQFDSEQRRMYGSEAGDDIPRYSISPGRQSSPFPHDTTNRRYFKKNRNSKGEEIFSGDTSTLSRHRDRRPDDFVLDNNARNARLCHKNGTQMSERECESPPEPAPPEVPPRGPSLLVTLRHRPCDPPQEHDRLYLSEGEFSFTFLTTKR